MCVPDTLAAITTAVSGSDYALSCYLDTYWEQRHCTLVMARIVIFNIREYECQNEYFILIFANANANIAH